MRLIYGGLFFLLLLVSHASAQITGRVDVIGFDGKYRPGCWTPMLVRLTSNGSPTDLYELRVWQYDQDRDRPYFSRRINLSADRGEQSFWTYFIPEAIHEGLTNVNSTQAELAQRLKITIHDKSGKELAQIPLGSATAVSVDPSLLGFGTARARRFIVFVGPGAVPPLGEYGEGKTVGLQEDIDFSRVTPDRLPESSLGYEGVDAVVWLDGSPTDLAEGQSQRLEALQEYVRLGGKFIISTQPQWQELAGFGDLMPVDITGMELNGLQSPVRGIAAEMPFPRNVTGVPRDNPWENFTKALSIATAVPKPGAVVDLYAQRVLDSLKPEDRTPWLVRMPYGYGSTVWVGQDLGNRELTDRANWGWSRVWETVLGSGSMPITAPGQSAKMRFQPNGNVDFGFSVIDGMNLTGRGAALVGVTIAFFIFYWLIAGPGTYFFLRFKGKSTLSWFVFGAMALAATGVTLLLVRVMLRGSPEMKHITLVRSHGDTSLPAMVSSRMGIYIPRDGVQQIVLGKGDPRFPSTLTPFPIHPTIHQRKNGDSFLFDAPREYRVPLPGSDENVPAEVDMPFRTTMKRLRASWVGPTDQRLVGDAKLMPSVRGEGYIGGALRNQTGFDLKNIYIAFRHQPEEVGPTLWMMHIPAWKAGETLDLGKAFNPPANKRAMDITVNGQNVPFGEFPVRGMLQNWIDRFKGEIRAGGGLENLKQINGMGDPNGTTLPFLSLFNALPILENEGGSSTRADIHRSGLRDWDISGALQAGELVVIAERNNAALPMPMTIEGENVEGNGTVVYQFILPLTPMLTAPMVTTPTTQPASPSTEPVSNEPTPVTDTNN